MAGHLGITVNKDMLNFAQNFGLIVFVYTLGLQVGPGFFSSLKKGGVEMPNIFSRPKYTPTAATIEMTATACIIEGSVSVSSNQFIRVSFLL